MIVNSDSGRQSTMKLLGSYPSLQVLLCPPSFYVCTKDYPLSGVTAIYISHTALKTSNIAINILFLFGFILGLDVV